jgi:steroid delta-isomerase-like uncharacterized protein
MAMTTEQHKAALRRIYDEVLEKGNLSVVDELIGSNYVFHGPGGMELKGPDGFKEFVKNLRKAFPDLRVTADDMVAEGNEVAHRGTLRGTQKGEFMGIPATGRRISLSMTAISRFDDGHEVEAWEFPDTAGMYQQLGVSPQDQETRVRRVIDEALNKGNVGALDEIMAPEVICHQPPGPDISGLPAYKQFTQELRKAYSDMHFTVDEFIRQGETDMIRYTMRGVHTGSMPGGVSIPPTGRRVAMTGVEVIHTMNGKAVEQWIYNDTLGLMQQLGVTPQPRRGGK